MTTSSRAKPQTRPARTLEHARKLCPSEDEGDRIADAFGLDQVAVGLIRASTKEALAQLAGPLADHMSETGLRVFLQRLVASFVDSACKTGEFYDAKVAEAKRANAKLHCDARDEDLPGVAGFASRAQRTREFAAQLAMQAMTLLAAAEGAVQAFEHLTGDSWRPYMPTPAVSLDRRAGEAQLATFGR